MFAIVCWAAKPTTRPSTAVEARMPVASRLSSVNWLRIIAATTRKTTRPNRRRMIRSRVWVERDTCETAGDMAVRLNRPFPYADWGPPAALLGVLLALVAGALLGVPAILIDQPH